MKRLVAATLFALGAGLCGFSLGHHSPTEAVAQDNPKPEKIANLEKHLAGDEEYQSGDLAQRLAIIGALQKAQRLDWAMARGYQMRVILAHARANEMDPESNLVPFVKWLGTQLKDWKGDIYKACGGTGSLGALIEIYGARRLYRDETFLKGDAEAKLRRLKELFDAREIDQTQCYDLTRLYAFEHLSSANGDIDKQIEMLGKLHKAKCMEWAGASSVHRSLLTRALDEKKDLDTVEKKLAWLIKVTDNSSGDLSWMIVGSRRVTLFMHAVDGQMAELEPADRKARIAAWKEKGLLTTSDVRELEAAYCVNE
jgi:hypothetical protein